MNDDKIKEMLLRKEEALSVFAIKSSEAVRIKEEKEDIRPAFFHDVDRIIHSMAYTRYINKTQVFSFSSNDHITTRIIHVSLVSKIARTIGRLLNLNEDLIEAIALGHDIGHTPLGHEGEHILSEISTKELNEPFMHNIQSVRNYIDIETNTNLTIQVLDGMMCHNGEILHPKYEPKKKTKEEFLTEYNLCLKDSNYAKKIRPMTLEGCVVRISDIIAYIGRDIEDAIKIGAFDRTIIPEDIKDVLGDTNKSIINSIVLDIVYNSYDKPYIKLSDEIFEAVNKLKKFNYDTIYHKANSKENLLFYKEGMNRLFNRYLKDLELNNKSSNIYILYLNERSEKYINDTSKQRIVIDFLAGMTDDFFMKEIKDLPITVNKI